MSVARTDEQRAAKNARARAAYAARTERAGAPVVESVPSAPPVRAGDRLAELEARVRFLEGALLESRRVIDLLLGARMAPEEAPEIPASAPEMAPESVAPDRAPPSLSSLSDLKKEEQKQREEGEFSPGDAREAPESGARKAPEKSGAFRAPDRAPAPAPVPLSASDLPVQVGDTIWLTDILTRELRDLALDLSVGLSEAEVGDAWTLFVSDNHGQYKANGRAAAWRSFACRFRKNRHRFERRPPSAPPPPPAPGPVRARPRDDLAITDEDIEAAIEAASKKAGGGAT